MTYKYTFHPRVKMSHAFEGFWIWLADRHMERITFQNVTVSDHIECYLSGEQNNQIYHQYLLLMGMTTKVNFEKVS